MLQNLKTLTQVSAELEMAIQAGPLATAKLCVRLRHEVEAQAEQDPAKQEQYRNIGNALFSRINELVHATSHSPLQYRQLAAVAEWWNTFRPAAVAAPAQEQSAETPVLPGKTDRGTFADAYYTGGKLVASAIGPKGESFEQFKARQGPLVSTSDAATGLQRARNPYARKVLVELDGDDLIEIYERKVAKPSEDKTAWAQTNEKLRGEMPRINAAFRMMKLDTSGAQAHYLANAYMESSQLQFMTETEKAADRRYAYLFSAASRKRRMATKEDPVGTRLDSQVASSSSPATAGMGDHSQLPESAKRKAQIFSNAIRVINQKNPPS